MTTTLKEILDDVRKRAEWNAEVVEEDAIVLAAVEFSQTRYSFPNFDRLLCMQQYDRLFPLISKLLAVVEKLVEQRDELCFGEMDFDHMAQITRLDAEVLKLLSNGGE